MVCSGPDMKMILMRWLILTLAVWVAASIVPGITYNGWQGLLIASLVLSVLNTFVRPMLNLLSLPFIILTFGLFLLVTNAVLLILTGWLVKDFDVAGFWPAVGGSLVISIVSMFLGYPRHRGTLFINRTGTIGPDRRRPPPGRGPIIDV